MNDNLAGCKDYRKMLTNCKCLWLILFFSSKYLSHYRMLNMELFALKPNVEKKILMLNTTTGHIPWEEHNSER